MPPHLSATFLHLFLWTGKPFLSQTICIQMLAPMPSVCLWAGKLVFLGFNFFSCKTETLVYLRGFLEGSDNLMSMKYLTQSLMHCKCSINTSNICDNHTSIWWHFSYLSVFSYSLFALSNSGRQKLLCLFSHTQKQGSGELSNLSKVM